MAMFVENSFPGLLLLSTFKSERKDKRRERRSPGNEVVFVVYHLIKLYLFCCKKYSFFFFNSFLCDQSLQKKSLKVLLFGLHTTNNLKAMRTAFPGFLSKRKFVRK